MQKDNNQDNDHEAGPWRQAAEWIVPMVICAVAAWLLGILIIDRLMEIGLL